MSNSYIIVNKNGIRLISLLMLFFLGSSFVVNDKSDINDKKRRKKIVSTAQKYIGTKYRSGGKTPKGFDCSGFSYYVYKQNKIKLGASSRAQARQGKQVKFKDLKPGDLIFFGSKKYINHVGIVTKQSRNKLYMIHSSSSRGIVEEEIYSSNYWKSRMQFGRSVF